MTHSFWLDVLKLGLSNILVYTKSQTKVIGLTILLFTMGFVWVDLSFGWALLIAIGISILDLLPVIGAGMIFIPWILVEWLTGDVSQGWKLLAIYVLVEVITELIEPFFLGRDLAMPLWLPAVIMILCSILFNVWGILIASLAIPFISAYRTVLAKYRT